MLGPRRQNKPNGLFHLVFCVVKLKYVNDLPSIPENCSSQCYVDDTKFLMCFQLHEQHEAITKMKLELVL